MGLLKVTRLSKRFGGLHAVKNMDMNLAPGKITSLIGPNGAGKSTMINLITGFISPTEGTVEFDGKVINSLPPYKIVQAGLARTFQHPQVLTTFSVLESVMMGAHSYLKFGLFDGITWSRREHVNYNKAVAGAEEIIDFLGLEKKGVCGHLSYGEKRMVELGRAMASQPKLILLDEPAAGLNSAEREVLKDVILKLRNKGITVLLVEHDMPLVMEISDYVVVLNFGEKIAEGVTEEVRRNPKVVEAYLGGSVSQIV